MKKLAFLSRTEVEKKIFDDSHIRKKIIANKIGLYFLSKEKLAIVMRHLLFGSSTNYKGNIFIQDTDLIYNYI